MTIAMALSGMIAFAQNGNVGINIERPSATLGVKAKTNNGSKVLELQNSQSAKLVNVLDNGNVGIGVENPTKKLEVAGSVKITDGTQGAGKVLTSDANGNATWQAVTQTINNNVNYSVTSQVDYNILGYIPSTTATASATPEFITIGTTLARKKRDFSYASNGHTYAAYVAEQTITWYDAYEAAKSMGGYLATFTTDEEWKSVEMGLLEPDTSMDNVSFWLGMARFEWFAGGALQPAVEMKWITGELPRHDYAARGTNAVRKSNWFNPGEPNNSAGVEGFVHTFTKTSNSTKTHNGYTTKRTWNDLAANSPHDGKLKGFIVEFQQ